VARGARRVEYVAKPGALLALLAWAATAPAPSPWLLAALACSLAGDVFLMLPVDAFLAGVGAFLLAHAAYVVAFEASWGARLAWLVPAAVILLPLAIRLLGAAPERLRPALGTYMAVITLMLASALASSNIVAAVGAVLFVGSDSLIAWNRFVRPFAWAQPAIMVTYHLGQLGLASALR